MASVETAASAVRPAKAGVQPHTGAAVGLLTPVLVVFGFLYILPLGMLVRESYKVFEPGRIGGLAGTFTIDNYASLVHPVYLGYFLDTFRLSLFAAIFAVVLGFPLAHLVARSRPGGLRTLLIGFLVCMLFLGIIVRVYSLALMVGPVGFLYPAAAALGLAHNDVFLVESTVVLGLVHTVVPIVALTLVGTIQNVSPRLEDAGQSLGAPRWKVFMLITVPLCMRGLTSGFLLAYAVAVSSFVVPMVLGKGIVVFATNLIYERFSEVADFPGGSAIAVVMLILSVGIVYGLLELLARRFQTT